MKIAKDKKLHFIAGAYISFFVTIVFMPWVMFSPWIGFGVGTLIGVLKEIYDMRTPSHTAEIMDAIYTVGGAGTVSLIIYLIMFFV